MYDFITTAYICHMSPGPNPIQFFPSLPLLLTTDWWNLIESPSQSIDLLSPQRWGNYTTLVQFINFSLFSRVIGFREGCDLLGVWGGWVLLNESDSPKSVTVYSHRWQHFCGSGLLGATRDNTDCEGWVGWGGGWHACHMIWHRLTLHLNSEKLTFVPRGSRSTFFRRMSYTLQLTVIGTADGINLINVPPTQYVLQCSMFK